MNTIVEQRKQKWLDFYDLNSPVSRILVVDLRQEWEERPRLWWENIEAREEWAYRRYMRQMETLDKIHDNTIPSPNMLTGTEIYAEAFGCKVHKPLNNNPSAMPLIHDVSEFYKIKKPRLEDTNLIKLFDEADHLKARIGEDVVFGLPNMGTPMDIAAQIWDKSDFYAAMFEEEPAVWELAGMVRELLYEFIDEWFRRYGKDFMAHCPECYMPYGISMSEDEIGIISNEMYRKYFEPDLIELSNRYGALSIHCCATARHQWESLKEIPNLKLLNIGWEADVMDSISFFRDSVAQMPFYDLSKVNDLPDAQKIHVARIVEVGSVEEAVEYANRFNETLRF